MSRKFKWVSAVTAMVLGLSLIACGAGSASKDGEPIQVGGNSAQAPAPKASYHVPVAADFTLEVKVLDKSCFGSAGCNITYRVDATYNADSGPMNPSITYELTYELQGTKDPKVATMRVTGDKYEREERDIVQTRSSGTTLKAVITSITPR